MRLVATILMVLPMILFVPTAVAHDEPEPCEDDGWHVDWVDGIFLPSDSSVELTSVVIYLVPNVVASETFTFFANALCLLPLVDMECLAGQALQPTASPPDPRTCVKG